MSMLTVLRAALRVGRVTADYPLAPAVVPPSVRGAPTINPSRCDGAGACVRVCPADAISLTDAGTGEGAALLGEREAPTGERVWQLDLAPCVFCGLCAEACPSGALTMSGEFELAVRSRDDLLTVVRHGGKASPSGTALTYQSIIPCPPVLAYTPHPPPPIHEHGTPPFGPPRVPASGSGGVGVDAKSFPLVRGKGWGGIRPGREGSPGDADGLGRALARRVRGALRRSLHIRHLDAGSDNGTDWELNALLNPIYDVQRLGIDVVASPRHADVLFVTGPVTRNLEAALRRTYEAMPRPGIVVAAGAEACGGGVLQGSYAHAGGVDRVLPVDVYIPGDPPRPEAIVYGLLLATDRIEQRRRRIEHSV